MDLTPRCGNTKAHDPHDFGERGQVALDAPARTVTLRCHGLTLLGAALIDLAGHPDSSAREIGRRIGANDRDVFRELDRAAYSGQCQRWQNPGQAWRWEIPA